MKKIIENKTSIYIVILVILIGVGLFFKYNKDNSVLDYDNTTDKTVLSGNNISIESKDIKEENFSGKVSVIKGDGELAIEAQSYIDQSVGEFKKQADTDVPAMRAEFGEDSPSSNYEIIIDAKYTKGEKTESIVILEYVYTGGAHGNSAYKVISASSLSGKILSLGDVIKKEKQNTFVDLVKKGLIDWRPYETTDTVVFVEDVEGLKFDSFKNWSLDDKNLTLYFSQYEIGPGVLGPVAFPISIDKIKDFLI